MAERPLAELRFMFIRSIIRIFWPSAKHEFENVHSLSNRSALFDSNLCLVVAGVYRARGLGSILQL